MLEMVREPGEMEERGMADSSISPVRVARAVETVVIERVIPGGRRIFLEDRLVVEIRPVRKREELDSEE